VGDTDQTATASCDAGDVAVGGGARANDADNNVLLVSSYPASSSTWTAVAHEFDNDGNWTLSAIVICSDQTP
jgi:hypothetical protein